MTEPASSVALPLKCSDCNAPTTSALYCSGCHTLHLDRDVNYFTALGLAPRYDVDSEELRRNYLALSRTLHPDRLRDADPQAALLASAKLNEARRVLSDPVLRAEYLLELAGGDSAADDKTVPPAVLGETLLLREELEAAQAAGDADALARLAADARTAFDAGLAEIARWAANLPGDAQSRRELRHALNALKYRQRLHETLAGARNS